jgi:hypothetical protein
MIFFFSYSFESSSLAFSFNFYRILRLSASRSLFFYTLLDSASPFLETATSIEVAVVNFFSLLGYFRGEVTSLVGICEFEGAKMLD